MMQSKEEIDTLILERVKENPNKVQFHVEVGMIKIPTVQDGGSGNFERTMLFLNTKILTVYFERIAGDQYWNWLNIWSTNSISYLLISRLPNLTCHTVRLVHFFARQKSLRFSFNLVRNIYLLVDFTEREAFTRSVATGNAGLAIAIQPHDHALVFRRTWYKMFHGTLNHMKLTYVVDCFIFGNFFDLIFLFFIIPN